MENKKLCTKCGRLLSFGAFHRQSSASDGRKSQCKQCRCEKQRQRRRDNAEAISERQRLRYANDEAMREAAIERAKRWSAQNPERRKEIRQTHYQENRDTYIEKAREWSRMHPERLREGRRRRQAARKALAKGNGGRISKEEWQGIIDAANGRCLYCGTRAKLVMDHFVPINRGGATVQDNMIPCCRSCNSKKGAKEPEVWVRQEYGEDVLRNVMRFMTGRR